MITVIDKTNCCGCSACAQNCPLHCITMREDEYGFLYPEANPEVCINCGLCEEVCLFLNKSDAKEPRSICAALNPDSVVRRHSSSGGIFTMLAESILDDKGVVFGAHFNEQWGVAIGYTESSDGLTAFRGSKYVQAVVGDSYKRAETFLQEGRKVLFSGTPCQILGLRLFLQKEYDNLLTVAIACHSVPSPLVWREYLKGLKFRSISNIQFRDKRIGWEQYGLKISYGNNKEFFQCYLENPYMQLFLNDITTRPSCFNCQAKDGKSGADIIIGDCWGISQILPDYPNDHLGTSFVLCYTPKGAKEVETVGIRGIELSYEKLMPFNRGMTNKKIEVPKKRFVFWNLFITADNKIRVLNHAAKPYLPGLKAKLKKLF